MDTPDAVLSIDQVVLRFGGRPVLDGLSLELHAGEVFALLAPNGAGKTTTLNLVLGFLSPDSGTISVCGRSVGADPALARRAIAYLPEQVALIPELSGLENLRYFLLLAELAPDEASLRRLLDEAGLPSSAHGRAARHYSKGMRQKVGIAIALARQARLLLLDEPTSGLDPRAAAELTASVHAAAARGAAVLMVTHDLYHIKGVATRAGFLHGGRIVRELDPHQVDHAGLERQYIAELAR